MSDGFFVDPDALESAVAGATSASGALMEARDGLAIAQARIESALTWGFVGQSARHKTSTFVRQWREELEKLGEGLTTLDMILREVARSYRESETALSAAVREALNGPSS